MYRMIGDILLFAVSLPLIALQTFLGMEALMDVFAQISEYTSMK